MNPYFRPTADELLKNKIFDEIRIPESEKKSPFKIHLEFDVNEYKMQYDGTVQSDLDEDDTV